MIIKNGNIYCSDFTFQKKDLYIHDGIIISDEAAASEDGIVIDATGKYIVPGLVDIHSHGAKGHDFCDADAEGLMEILSYEKSCGITSYCPTSMTYSYEILKDIFETIKNIDSNNDLADIAGINMEGPFISFNKRGAQNEKYIQAPDIEMFRELNRICDNKIKLITIAPEVEGSAEFINAVKDEVNISIGHTEANYQCATNAFLQGVNHVTHLCNAMPPFLHRDTGVFGAAADNPNVYVELICDGIHIHPSMIRTIFKVFGANRICLISDSMEATGMKDGQYQLGGQKVFKKGNYATLEDGTLAGSASNLFDCMKNAVEFGISIEDAVRSATATPASSIGLYPNIGSLSIGAKADILILSEKLELEKII